MNIINLKKEEKKMDKKLVLKIECFNLKYTLECGQCFRWNKIAENEYIGVVKDRVIKIKQEKDVLVIKSSNYENLENVIKEYFDLNKDYNFIEKRISQIDENIKDQAEDILKQLGIPVSVVINTLYHQIIAGTVFRFR